MMDGWMALTNSFRRSSVVFIQTVDQWVFTLVELLRGLWDFDHPILMCFVNLEMAFSCIP